MNHENLWAPWRMAYLRELSARQDRAAGAVPPKPVNFLRAYWESPQHDEQNLVVLRTDDGLVLLNRYPYANGHLMACLGEARPCLADYEPSQRAAFWRLVETAAELARLTLDPQGLNIGINEGAAAGAGLPEHVPAHVVPRWNGDTHFMAAVGGIRVNPDSLEAMAAEYRRTIARLGGL
ncbi:MAG: HIT domain-containing protein [Phycisphaerales bacterium]